MAGRENAGDEWQAAVKYVRGEMGGRGLDLSKRPQGVKAYPDALRVVALPRPETEGGAGLWKALAGRRTRRTYRPEPLGLNEVSQLLWAGYGRSKEGREHFLRTAPSAGALYPIEVYLMANRVDGLEPGIYHFDAAENALSLIKAGEFGTEAAQAALGQATLEKCGAAVFMTAVVERCRWKYGQRAYRYIFLDAGHIGENLCLAAEGLGLGICPVGAFYDDELNGILGVDGVEETVIYAMAVGR